MPNVVTKSGHPQHPAPVPQLVELGHNITDRIGHVPGIAFLGTGVTPFTV